MIYKLHISQSALTETTSKEWWGGLQLDTVTIPYCYTAKVGTHYSGSETLASLLSPSSSCDSDVANPSFGILQIK